MRLGQVLLGALREARGGRARVLFFLSCLTLGVAAITGVASLVASIEGAISSQSRELMGADFELTARRPIDPHIDALLTEGQPLERADVRELSTLALAGERTRLVELKAVSANFPFYGAVELEPAAELGRLLDAQTCAVAPSLLDDLGLELGQSLQLGGQEFRIGAAVLDEPGRLDLAFTLGPRVFVGLDGLARTQLDTTGSRIRYRALYRAPELSGPESIALMRERLDSQREDAAYLRLASHRDVQPTLRRSLERVERYLGLLALLSLVLGGTGVAQIVRAWVAARTQSVAVLRVLGLRPSEVLWMYLAHVGLLGVLGSLCGAALGAALPFALAAAMPDLLPFEHGIALEPSAILRGLGLGVFLALAFALPELTALWRVPPARVLTSEAAPLSSPLSVRLASWLALAAALLLAAWWQSRDWQLALGFCGGLAALIALLTLFARGLTALAARLPRERFDPYLRHGIAALARPGAGVSGALVALGLGVWVVAAMLLVEGRLSQRLRTALPADAPSMFLIDVQSDQLAGVRQLLEDAGAVGLQHTPVLTARLASIDGVDVATLAERQREQSDPGRARWVLTREQRLTWSATLPADNRILEGALWSEPGVLELSLEQDFARDLGARLGTRLGFDVQGVPIELRVTSIRSVEWETFGVNFFLVAEPGALDAAPHQELLAARLEPAAERALQQRLATDYPNVTPISVRAILDKVVAILERLALAVSVLGWFAILTGLAILAGVASSSGAQRLREVALLKALGVTRWGVVRLLGLEFGLIGLVAGLLGTSAAFGLAWLFLEYALEIGAQLPWWSLGLGALGCAFASALSGLLASWPALQARPLESLRA